MATMLRCCLFAALFGMAFAKNTYIIMAPNTVRPGMDFEVSVNILKSAGDVNVTAKLGSTISASAIVKQGQLKRILLKVPERRASSFYNYLLVSGSGGLNFTDGRTVKYMAKRQSIFIQTDKAKYKAEQTVHFRVFAIHPNMKMYTGAYDIDIYDPKSNKIKRWVNVSDTSGVITNFLQISSQPVLGDWKIKATGDDGTIKEKIFSVSEYILPKFLVTVDVPPYIFTTDKDVTATVKAKYTYGKPVKGTCTVYAKVVSLKWWYGVIEDHFVMNKTFSIDGERKVSFNMKEAWRHINDLTYIKFEANVTDGLTDMTLNGSNTVYFSFSNPHLYFWKEDAKTFKPGLKYLAHLQVQQPDGRPVLQSTEKVMVRIEVTSEIPSVGTTTPTPYYIYPATMSYYLPDMMLIVPVTGIVPIEVQVPANASSIYLVATYGQRYGSTTVPKSFSPSGNYIQVILQSQHISLPRQLTMDFEVKATEPVVKLFYQVLSRGTIVDSGAIDGNVNQDTFNLHIPLTAKMSPSARMIVYYIRQDGEIVTDSVNVDVEGGLQNQVSISMDKTSVQPGENLNIQVTADPQSLVNLLAVDQSVLLLKSDNDITQSQVMEELKTYDTLAGFTGGVTPTSFYQGGHGGYMPTVQPPIRPLIHQPLSLDFNGYPVYYGEKDASHYFEIVGVLVMTDAFLYRYIEPYHPPFMFPTSAPGGGGGSGQILKEVQEIRTDFPETWLWMNKTVGSDGKAIISTTVPDTITSWVASAFAVNTQTGLGVAPTTSKVRVFRPFFVSLNLPNSVTRGEHVALQAIVFNYLTQDVDAVVSLPQSHEYQNIIIDSNGRERTDSKDIIQTVHVKAGGAESVFIPVVPTTLGKIDITVSARSNLAADAVKRQLLVELEGTPKEYSIPIVVDLTNVTTFSSQAQISIPNNVVSESLKATLSATGDIMGPSVKGLENLLYMPTGCGEQNMIRLAPDVFITNYLKATNQLTKYVKEKAINFMEQGYQRELKYQHYDGSFSAFGNRDTSGSMWLTAYVIKTFRQAKPYIYIDSDIMTRGIDWMLGKQTSDGQFPDPAPVHYINTGGSGKGTALTAFVLITLLENNDLTGGIHQRISQATFKAVKYLESHTPTDDYSLAIVTYALQLAGSPSADTYFTKLNSHAFTKDGFKYWRRPESKTTQTKHYWMPPNNAKPIDIEMTSYALMIYQERKDYFGGLNIMKWIASQRNVNGGFSSTQDTVVALQSLSMMSYNWVKLSDLQVTISTVGFNYSFSINQKNSLYLQSAKLPSVPRSVQIDATGHGNALVQIGVFFNVDADVEEPTFNLTWNILEEDINSITLQTCASWLSADTSGMAVQEVGLPSGFEVDRDTITEMKILKRIETENKKVVLYFDEIGSTAVCITFNMMRTGLVAKSVPVPIRVYDYYQPTNQKTVFYESTVLKNSTICSVCVDCENCQMKIGV